MYRITNLIFSLMQIDLSCNLLVDLPETVGNLQDLKVAFFLIFVGIMKFLPNKELYKLNCLFIEGWEDFDERRRSKHQKQLDFRVGSSGVFDEGADDDRALK
ncbi:hypothetical protein BHM03_00059985 [Ensete ventricosum]|uniref:Uncharacterized protein n=1 Tax=Ensete ventricosum TaxID=4639 RepID=A0A426XRE1_ENSVE|nr:hypothetical protein B296_00054898 [Ensete ventricosum]RZS26625.1 hypothetical protein BHM03_00059985 [Ensete ventricosum]